jgi:hypothetical protein
MEMARARALGFRGLRVSQLDLAKKEVHNGVARNLFDLDLKDAHDV